MSNIEDVRNRLTMFGQSHLLNFYDELNENEKRTFSDDLGDVDFEETNQLFERAMTSMSADVEKLDSRMQPIPASKFESEENCNKEKLDSYYRCGLEEISKSHVGVLLMAGGQGTRLGVTYPKGMFSIGLLSGKTLFQVQAERIRRVQQLAEQETGRVGKITWYIMTSGPTVEPTKNFLKEKDYFGLNSDDVVIFQQGLLPCFNFNGKILLEDRNRISLAPDGNGGIYRALQKSGVLDDMVKRGIKCVHAHSVDNILIKVADPVFIGYCTTKGADCGVKVVKKAYPTEAVGVVCQVDGQFQVVEYSEITDKTANLTDSDGNLVFSAGNICNHFFSTSFLSVIADKYESELKLHVAKKKIPFINDKGEKVKPTSPNGIKIEKFVFDVFPFSKNFVTWEVPRHTEFSALKNADDAGKDCSSTSRKDIFNLHKLYVEKAGGTVIGDEVEISSLLSYAGEGLEDIVKGKTFITPVYLLDDCENSTTNGLSS
uniref:UDP-N-acetylglucosamine diphosphorylase n=1 Tax=Holotrichia parallela TaxID=93412 RepID=A0AA49EPQ9_HOLPA|nr:UDP-N-acetylglucosamine pyrophosphorylase [Holotrichia parallela]